MKYKPFFLLPLLVSCTSNGPHLLLEQIEVSYLNDTVTTLIGTPIHLDAMGMNDIMFCDSFLILTSSDANGMISVYDPTSCERIMQLCHKGRARNEFNELSTLYSQHYIKDGKTMIPLLDDMISIKELDFTNSIKRHSALITQTGLCPPDGNFGMINNDFNILFNCSRVTADDAKQNVYYPPKYSIIDIEKQKEIKKIKVYSKRMMDIEDVNYYNFLYQGGIYKHPEKNMFIQVFASLDYLYYFDIDNDKKFALHHKGTISFEDHLSVSELSEIKNTFTTVLCTPDYIFTLHRGNIRSYEDKENTPNLYIFDWDGNFVCGAKMGVDIHRLAFDEKKRIMYGGNYIEEKIYSFDLNSLLNESYD